MQADEAALIKMKKCKKKKLEWKMTASKNKIN
jgi:hypothetical protein